MFSEEFFGKEKTAVEVRVKMIYDGKEGDIISQYVGFTKVFNSQIRKHGYTKTAVRETIRICRDRNILKEYLREREKEVTDIMFDLFDEDYILEMYVKDRQREAAEIAAKKASKKAAKKAAKGMYEKKIPVNDIADILEVSVETVEKWLGLVNA